MRFIAFDCDGTLVESQQTIMLGIRSAWQKEGLTPPLLSEVLNIMALPLLVAVETLNPNGDDEQNHRLKDTYLDAFTHMDTEIEEPLFDGVIETLHALNTPDTTMAIITGTSRQSLHKIMELHSLGQFFNIIKSADCGVRKPNPKSLLQAMTEAGADTTNTVIIGDTTYDVLMGKNAFISTIGVSYGYHSVDDLNQAGADRIVDNFFDLPNAIDFVLKR